VKQNALSSFRFDIDNKEYGQDPTARVDGAISAAKKEADQMFVDVLGRKDRADSTRNALNVLNRFKFLFNLPANIENNLSKNDYDRIIDEYERAKSLYGDSDSEIFKIYLDEIEKGVEVLKESLREKLKGIGLSAEQQKKLIANLVQLNVAGDPAWECLQVQYGHVLQTLDNCRDEYLQRSHHDAPKLLQLQQQQQQPLAMLSPAAAKNAALFPQQNDEHQEFVPHSVHFVEEVSRKLGSEFPNLWKLGQAYFKGDLVVEPDAGKSTVFKEMILGGIRYFSNLIRAAVIPSTLKEVEQTEYGSWGEENEKAAGQWLPSCLRHVRRSYASFIDLDLPGQALDIIKRLTTDLRIQCLQMIFQTVIDQVCSSL
jgi:exocyst complex component 2